MKTIRRAKIEKTGLRRPEDSGVYAMMSESKSEITESQLNIQEQYRLTLAVETTYWATDKEKARAREIAEKALAAMIYKEIAPRVSLAEHYVYNGDKERALEVLGEMRREIFGD